MPRQKALAGRDRPVAVVGRKAQAVQADLDRFLALVRRELGADDVRVLEAEQEGGADPCELQCRMADGRGVGARFLVAPADREAKQRRLEMLVSTFDGVV